MDFWQDLLEVRRGASQRTRARARTRRKAGQTPRPALLSQMLRHMWGENTFFTILLLYFQVQFGTALRLAVRRREVILGSRRLSIRTEPQPGANFKIAVIRGLMSVINLLLTGFILQEVEFSFKGPKAIQRLEVFSSLLAVFMEAHFWIGEQRREKRLSKQRGQ